MNKVILEWTEEDIRHDYTSYLINETFLNLDAATKRAKRLTIESIVNNKNYLKSFNNSEVISAALEDPFKLEFKVKKSKGFS